MTTTVPFGALNRTYWFTVLAYPKLAPQFNDSCPIGVIVGQRAGFDLVLWNPPPDDTYSATPPSTVSIRFELFNTGNGVDRFLIQGSSSRADVGLILEFVDGVDEYGYTEEVPPDPVMENPYFIDVRVRIPAWTQPNVEAIVSINTTSLFNVSYQGPSAVATVRALQYYNFQVYINGPDKKVGIPGETVTFQIKISNLGNGPDTFSLVAVFDKVLNPGFAAVVNPSNITIEPNDNGTALLVVEVPEDAPKKTYFITVEVASESDMLSPVTKSVAVEVGQFYGIELTGDNTTREIVPGG
ncbi:unnamed protein product, partial [marine sediment metagenome]